MNSIMENYYPMFAQYQALRNQLMETLSDADLAFHPGGENLSLGALCKEIGEVQQAYIQSFHTYRLDFSYRNTTPGLEGNVAGLRAWFDSLDTQLRLVIAEMSEETIQNQLIDRGPNFKLPVQINLDVYKEALLIFYGKASVYLKAMKKTRTETWQEWIA